MSSSTLIASVMCKHGGTERYKRKGIARKTGGRIFGANHEWQKCEH